MKRLAKLLALAVAVYVVATKGGRERLKRAREAYAKEVAAGARPIEAVGTAVAAFVGLAPGGPVNTRSPDVVEEEQPPAPLVDLDPEGDPGTDPEALSGRREP